MTLYKRAKYHPNMVVTSQKIAFAPRSLSLYNTLQEVQQFAQQAAH